MFFYETFILILTFLMLNVPVFIPLYRYVLKDANPFAKLAAGIFYWTCAFFTNQLMPFIGVLILLIKVHSKEESELQTRDFNIWSISLRDILMVSGAAVFFKVAISGLNKVFVDLLNIYLKIEAKPQEIVGEFIEGETFYKLALFVLVVVLAPFVEEYIFRYYLYDKLLLPRMPAAAAAVISTALFTMLHLNVSGIPTFFGLGLYCTFIYEKKGFYGAVVTHLVSNLVTAAFLM